MTAQGNSAMNKLFACLIVLTLCLYNSNISFAACEDEELTIEETFLYCADYAFSDTSEKYLIDNIKSAAANAAMSSALKYLSKKGNSTVKKILVKKWSKSLYNGGAKKLAKKLSKKLYDPLAGAKPISVALFILKEFILIFLQDYTQGEDTQAYIWASAAVEQAFIAIDSVEAGPLWVFSAIQGEVFWTLEQIIKATEVAKTYYETLDALEISVLQSYIINAGYQGRAYYRLGIAGKRNGANSIEYNKTLKEFKRSTDNIYYINTELFKMAGIKERIMANAFASIKTLLIQLHDEESIYDDYEKSKKVEAMEYHYDIALDAQKDEENDRFCFFQEYMFTDLEWKLFLDNAHKVHFCGNMYMR